MENTQEIFTHLIDLPPNNMRTQIDRDAIFELADDIKKNGLINAITVRPKNERYEVVAGQRRYLAHQFGGIIKIKCHVRELSDDEALAIMTSENLVREDVNPVDEANHVGRLMESKNGDIKSVAHIVGRSEKWVNDRIAISKMPDYMQNFLGAKQLPIGVALVLVQISDEGYRKMWTEQAVRDGVSIATAEYWLYDFRRRLLPGGELAEEHKNAPPVAPPSAVMLRCAIDGQEYDARLFKSVLIAECNVEYFNAFVSAFRNPTAEI